MTKLRMLLLNEFGYDLGDQATFAGFASAFGALSDRIGVDVQVEQASISQFRFRENNIESINATYDVIVLAGGGVFQHRESHESPSGWSFNISEDVLDRLTVPLAVYAAGCGHSPYAIEPFPPHTASHIRKTAAKAFHFSVREHGTMRFLRDQMDVQTAIDFVPDAAVHVEPTQVAVPGLDASKKKLGLSLRLEAPEESFPSPADESFMTFVRELLAAAKTLVKDHELQLVFISHFMTSLDVEIADLLKAALPEGSVVLLHEALPEIYEDPSFDNASKLAGVYAQMDAVLGKRVHSVVLPWLVGTPVVSMSSMPATRWMQDELGGAELHINMTDFVSQVRSDVFVEKVQNALAQMVSLQARYAQRRAELIAVSNGANENLLRAAVRLAAERGERSTSQAQAAGEAQ